MELFISAVRPQAGAGPVVRDLVVTAQEDATVADLARTLDEHLPEAPSQVDCPRLPVVGLWAGATPLDPGAPLTGGLVHDGMVLGVGGPVEEALAPGVSTGAGGGEPGGVVELRVVSGRGAGAVHRLGLGAYTLGGKGCDLVVEGLEGRVATVEVRVGGAVLLDVEEQVARRMAPEPPPRRRPLPGPVVLADDTDGEGDGKEPRGGDGVPGGADGHAPGGAGGRWRPRVRRSRRAGRGSGGRSGGGAVGPGSAGRGRGGWWRRRRRAGRWGQGAGQGAQTDQAEGAGRSWRLWGRQGLDPEAPRRWVELDRRPLQGDGKVAWAEGAVLTVGESLLTVGHLPPSDAVVSPSVGGVTVDFNRPPRLARAVRPTEFALPRAPQAPRRQAFPFAMMVSPMVMGAGMYLMTGRAYSLLFMVLSPLMMIANRLQGRSNSRRAYKDAMEVYERQSQEVEEAAWRALAGERSLRRGDFPDAAELLVRATGPRSGLWERRPGDADWLELRVGTADLPSDVVLQDPGRARHEDELRWTAPDVPVTVSLAGAGVAGVHGAGRHRSAAWLAAQAAVLHSPAELELVVVVDPGQGRPGVDRWGWAAWLPHLRTGTGGARARVGVDEASVARRLGELVDLVEARTAQAGRASGDHDVPGPQVLVVLDGAHALRQRPGVIHLLRAGPRVGVYCLCVEAGRTGLPQECSAVVDTGATAAGTGAEAMGAGVRGVTAGAVGVSVSVAGQDVVERVLADRVPEGWCDRVARALAPVRDVSAQGEDGAVPTSSRLLDVVGLSEPTGEVVLSGWQRGGRTTRAVIGEDSEGPFSVDVRADGPHGLVAGTTGSGKSELLQTLVASLAVGNTPEAMVFVLVDYKGGAAFKDCARLPHTVGMVTDLDAHLTGRALESLGAELRRRERQLAGAGAKDIEDYTAATGPDGNQAGGTGPMPRLVIIIDEFAALAAELPEFVEGLVDVARRGRSLGVHLVLATQRPAGVVTAEIRSNTNLRIALRVTDEADSQDVVDSSAAAHIAPSVPGRAYARLGHAALRAFQSSRVGGRPPGVGPRAALRATLLDLTSLAHPDPAALDDDEGEDQAVAAVPTDLACLVEAARAAFELSGWPAPRSPWLPPLPDRLCLDEVDNPHDQEQPGPTRAHPTHDQEQPTQHGQGGQDPRGEGLLPPVVVGLADVPADQDQRPALWDYTRTGHLGVAGAPRSGRSALLRTLAAGVARTASPEEVHLYGIDAGAGALLPLLGLPHTGAVVTRSQTDRIRRLLALLAGEVARRQQHLAERGFASLAEQRAASAQDERLPYIVLVIDRWDSFTAAYESSDGGVFLEQVEALMREGVTVGLRVVVAGDRRVFRGRFGMALEDRVMLRMPEPEDYDPVDLRARDVPTTMPPGRAFRLTAGGPQEVQVAVLPAGQEAVVDASGGAQAAAVHATGAWARGYWGEVPRGRRPGGVDELPVTITASQALGLGPSLGPGEVALAVGGDTLGLLPIDLADVGNSLLVAGPRRSGRSTALLFATTTALAGGLSVVLVLPRRSPLAALEDHSGVVGVLDLDAKALDLEKAVGKDPGRTLVVIDDYDVLGNDHAVCAAVQQHLRDARDTPGGLLVACGVDEAISMYGGLMVQVKRARTGLLLAPRSSNDGNVLDVRLPRSVGGPVPRGRGVLVATTGWSWVQVPAPDVADKDQPG